MGEQHVKKCNYGIKRGENHGRAKLTDHEVELLRTMVERGDLTQAEASAKFEISAAQVNNIVHYRQR